MYYIFALQRSGTNFLEDILRRNFQERKLNTHPETWKHSLNEPEELQDKPALMMHKNPYLWVESICTRNCADWKQTQNTYPHNEFKDGYMINEFNIENLAKSYRHFMDTWLDNPRVNMRIRYEDLLTDNKNIIIDEIGDVLGKKTNRYYIPRSGAVSQSGTYTDKMSQYYINGIPEKMEPHHMEIIETTIGRDIITNLGYS